MDFSQFDSVAASNRGAWMHVNSPITGKPIYADDDKTKPCRVLVYGAEGDIGQRLFAEARADLRNPGEKGEDDGDVFERIIARTKPLIGGFENIHRGDKPASVPDDVEWFLRLQRVVGGDKPSFAEQVQAFSLRRANIMGNGSGG